MSQVPPMFNVIEKLNEEYSDLSDKYEELKKDYEYQKSKHIEYHDAWYVLKLKSDFEGIYGVDGSSDFWYELIDDYIKYVKDNVMGDKKLFLKCLQQVYTIYDDKWHTFEEMKEFCMEIVNDHPPGYAGDFTKENQTEEAVLSCVDGWQNYVHKHKFDGIDYYVMFE